MSGGRCFSWSKVACWQVAVHLAGARTCSIDAGTVIAGAIAGADHSQLYDGPQAKGCHKWHAVQDHRAWLRWQVSPKTCAAVMLAQRWRPNAHCKQLRVTGPLATRCTPTQSCMHASKSRTMLGPEQAFHFQG